MDKCYTNRLYLSCISSSFSMMILCSGIKEPCPPLPHIEGNLEQAKRGYPVRPGLFLLTI